jgi:hypothetical protein
MRAIGRKINKQKELRGILVSTHPIETIRNPKITGTRTSDWFLAFGRDK